MNDFECGSTGNLIRKLEAEVRDTKSALAEMERERDRWRKEAQDAIERANKAERELEEWIANTKAELQRILSRMQRFRAQKSKTESLT